MQKSKTTQCRIFWCLVITASLAFTAMNLYQASYDFIYKPSDVSLSRHKMNHILYPPLKLCLGNWMSWANWSAAEDLNFTKQEVLFAMSHMTYVFAEEPFDENETENSFHTKLLAKKWSIEQFYAAIAQTNKIIEDIPEDKQKFSISFQVQSEGDLDPPNYWLCYQISEEQVSSFIHNKSDEYVYQTSLDRILLTLNFGEFVVNRSRIPELLTKYEYDAQLFPYFNSGYVFNKGEKAFFSGFFYPDGYGEDFIAIGGWGRYAILNTEAFSWRNSTAEPCVEGRKWIESNQTCPENCEGIFERQVKEGVLKRNFNKITLRKKIFFGKLNQSEIEEVWSDKRRFKLLEPNDRNRSRNWTNIQEQAQVEYDECMKTCELEIGCEKWSYSFTSDAMASWETPAFLISYPSNIAVMKEVNLQTWENFTSNIGGVLGIWTGASVLTIFQLIYLCFSKVSTVKPKPPPQHGNGLKETIFSSQVPPPDDELFVPVPHRSTDLHHVSTYP